MDSISQIIPTPPTNWPFSSSNNGNIIDWNGGSCNRQTFLINSDAGFYTPCSSTATGVPPVTADVAKFTYGHQQQQQQEGQKFTYGHQQQQQQEGQKFTYGSTPHQQQQEQEGQRPSAIFRSLPPFDYRPQSQNQHVLPRALSVPNGPHQNYSRDQYNRPPTITAISANRRCHTVLSPTLTASALLAPRNGRRRSVVEATRRLFAFWASLLAMIITAGILLVLRWSINNHAMSVHLCFDPATYTVSMQSSCVIGLTFIIVLASFAMEFFHLILASMCPVLGAWCLRLRTRAFIYLTFSLLATVMAVLQSFNIAVLLGLYMIPSILFYAGLLRGEDRILSPYLKPRTTRDDRFLCC